LYIIYGVEGSPLGISEHDQHLITCDEIIIITPYQ